MSDMAGSGHYELRNGIMSPDSDHSFFGLGPCTSLYLRENGTLAQCVPRSVVIVSDPYSGMHDTLVVDGSCNFTGGYTVDAPFPGRRLDKFAQRRRLGRGHQRRLWHAAGRQRQ